MKRHLDRVREFALSFPGAWEDHPWGPEESAIKTPGGKVFVFCGDNDGRTRMTVKLTPDEGGAALTLPFVSVAAYVGRYGWVTATVSDNTELEIALDWIRRSHELVASRKAREFPRRAGRKSGRSTA